MNEEAVEKAKKHYVDVNRNSNLIIVSAYVFAFFGFLLVLPLISMRDTIDVVLLFIVVIVTPGFVAQIMECRRMHAVLKLSLAILQYIDDNNEIKPIPVMPPVGWRRKVADGEQ